MQAYHEFIALIREAYDEALVRAHKAQKPYVVASDPEGKVWPIALDVFQGEGFDAYELQAIANPFTKNQIQDAHIQDVHILSCVR